MKDFDDIKFHGTTIKRDGRYLCKQGGWEGMHLIHVAQFRDKWLWALFEHDNANPASIKCEEFLNLLRNYNILKRDLVAIGMMRIIRWLADIMAIYQQHTFRRGVSR
jgi:hypothetical protein